MKTPHISPWKGSHFQPLGCERKRPKITRGLRQWPPSCPAISPAGQEGARSGHWALPPELSTVTHLPDSPQKWGAQSPCPFGLPCLGELTARFLTSTPASSLGEPLHTVGPPRLGDLWSTHPDPQGEGRQPKGRPRPGSRPEDRGSASGAERRPALPGGGAENPRVPTPAHSLAGGLWQWPPGGHP